METIQNELQDKHWICMDKMMTPIEGMDIEIITLAIGCKFACVVTSNMNVQVWDKTCIICRVFTTNVRSWGIYIVWSYMSSSTTIPRIYVLGTFVKFGHMRFHSR